VARKFSLKDNPIFQRLEVPRRQEAEARPEAMEITPPTPELSRTEVSKTEGQKESRKNFPSKFEPQNLSLKKGEERTQLENVESDPRLDHPYASVPSIRAKEEEESGEAVDFTAGSPIPNTPAFTEGGKKKKNEDQDQTLKYRPSRFASLNSQQAAEIRRIPEAPPAVTSEGGAAIREESEKGLPEDKGISSERGAEDSEGVGALAKVSPESRPQASTMDLPPEGANPQDLGLKDNLDKSLFFSFYNEVNDELLPTLDAAEQILYSRLFRLSYGFNRNYCTVSQPILGEKTGLSRNTIRTGLQSLSQKEWISVIEAGNHISTTYRVYLPREKVSGANFDPQKGTLKNRPSNNERQKLSGKFRSSKIDEQGGQKAAVQNLSGKLRPWKFSNLGNKLQQNPANSDPQKMPPLLITNNSLTLSVGERERRFSDDQTLLTLAQELVDKFYLLLAQRPSTAKYEKSIAECLTLLRDGFSCDQIDYAMTWLVTHHPTTGSFSRVAHFIDQALKAREEKEVAREAEGRKSAELESKRLEEKRREEQGKEIDEVKASLSQEEVATLYQEASRLVENEHGQVRFGKETLIQIKVRELIRVRYLQSDHL
jgi:hypothetical protein